MFIDYSKKVIVSKSFKTASSSLYELLNKGANHNNSFLFNGHKTIKEIIDSYSIEPKIFDKLTIVRNPWDYVVSAYFWAKHNKECPPSYSFEDFILKDSKFNWRKQKKFWDLRYLDRVIYYEDFDNQCKGFCREYGYTYNKPPKIKSGIRPKKVNYRDVHSPNTIREVYFFFEKFIKELNYKYER